MGTKHFKIILSSEMYNNLFQADFVHLTYPIQLFLILRK